MKAGLWTHRRAANGNAIVVETDSIFKVGSDDAFDDAFGDDGGADACMETHMVKYYQSESSER